MAERRINAPAIPSDYIQRTALAAMARQRGTVRWPGPRTHGRWWAKGGTR